MRRSTYTSSSSRAQHVRGPLRTLEPGAEPQPSVSVSTLNVPTAPFTSWPLRWKDLMDLRLNGRSWIGPWQPRHPSILGWESEVLRGRSRRWVCSICEGSNYVEVRVGVLLNFCILPSSLAKRALDVFRIGGGLAVGRRGQAGVVKHRWSFDSKFRSHTGPPGGTCWS